MGGCRFFGNNRNGPKFFTPSNEDFVNSTATCVFNIIGGGDENVGYGQSVLFGNQLVLNDASFQLPAFRTQRPSIIDSSVFVENVYVGQELGTGNGRDDTLTRDSRGPDHERASLSSRTSKEAAPPSGKVVNFIIRDDISESSSQVLPPVGDKPHTARQFSRSLSNIRPELRSLCSQASSITGSDQYVSCPEDVSDSGSDRTMTSSIDLAQAASRVTSTSDVYSYKSCLSETASRVTSASDVYSYKSCEEPDETSEPADKRVTWNQRSLSDESLSSFVSAMSSQTGSKSDGMGSKSDLGMDTVIAAADVSLTSSPSSSTSYEDDNDQDDDAMMDSSGRLNSNNYIHNTVSILRHYYNLNERFLPYYNFKGLLIIIPHWFSPQGNLKMSDVPPSMRPTQFNRNSL